MTDEPCHNMLYCFLQTLNFGLKNGGGVGDQINATSDVDPIHWPEFWYNMGYFFFINILLLNVIFGTIINTFANLRNNRLQQELDMRNNCFMCNLNRDDIDRIGTPFD